MCTIAVGCDVLGKGFQQFFNRCNRYFLIYVSCETGRPTEDFVYCFLQAGDEF